MRNDAVTADGQGNIRHRQGPIRLGDGNFPEDMALGRTTVCPLSRFLSGRYSGSRTLGGVLGSYKIEGPHFAGPWLARGPSVFGAKTRLLACALLSLIWAVATWAPVRATACLLYETDFVSLSPNPHSRIQANNEQNVSTWDAGLRCECDRSYVGFSNASCAACRIRLRFLPGVHQIINHKVRTARSARSKRRIARLWWSAAFMDLLLRWDRNRAVSLDGESMQALDESMQCPIASHFFLPGKILQLTCVGSRDAFSGTHEVPVQEVPGLSRRRLR